MLDGIWLSAHGFFNKMLKTIFRNILNEKSMKAEYVRSLNTNSSWHVNIIIHGNYRDLDSFSYDWEKKEVGETVQKTDKNVYGPLPSHSESFEMLTIFNNFQVPLTQIFTKLVCNKARNFKSKWPLYGVDLKTKTRSDNIFSLYIFRFVTKILRSVKKNRMDIPAPNAT